MATYNSELALVRRFHGLSQNYETRPAIARRNTLPTLSRFLTSKDRDIRKLALDAVYMLAQHPENVELLANEEAITNGVFSIYKEAQYDDPELYELSSKTLDYLCVSMPNGDPRRAELIRRAAEGGQSSSGSPSQSRSGSPSAVEPAGQSSTVSDSQKGTSGAGSAFSSTANQSSHVITLEIPALNTRTDTTDLETILQKCRGVLSYTISSSTHQVRVFMASRALKPLQEELSAAGFVNLVVSDDRIARRDSVGSVQQTSYYDDDDAAGKRPGYLQKARTFASSFYNAVMLYTDNRSNTLAARVQRQRELDQAQRGDTADKLAKTFANWW